MAQIIMIWTKNCQKDDEFSNPENSSACCHWANTRKRLRQSRCTMTNMKTNFPILPKSSDDCLESSTRASNQARTHSILKFVSKKKKKTPEVFFPPPAKKKKKKKKKK